MTLDTACKRKTSLISQALLICNLFILRCYTRCRWSVWLPHSPSSSSVRGRYCSTRLSEVLRAVSTPVLTIWATLLSSTVLTLPVTTALVFSIPSCTAPRVFSTALVRVSETVSLAPDTVPVTTSLAVVTTSLALETIWGRGKINFLNDESLSLK